MHSRQEPNGSRLSVAHSFGTCVPMLAAAAMMEVPFGTVTDWPSMVSVTVVFATRMGVPVSSSRIRVMP